MDRDEKFALKAACIRAAAALLAGIPKATELSRSEPFRARAQPGADTGSCARYARDLFGKLTGEPWD
jgi:hypothetical protein